MPKISQKGQLEVTNYYLDALEDKNPPKTIIYRSKKNIVRFQNVV